MFDRGMYIRRMHACLAIGTSTESAETLRRGTFGANGMRLA